MKKTRFYILFNFGLLISILVPHLLSANFPADVDKSEDNKRLFIIARSKNANIICYDLNFISAGKLDPEKPIHVYWYNQTDKPGTKDELSYFQEKMAYGYTARQMETNKWEVTLVAFPQRKLILEKSGEGIYRSHILISGRQAVLKKIYVQANPTNSLRVQWVDIFGIDMQTGNEVKERILP